MNIENNIPLIINGVLIPLVVWLAYGRHKQANELKQQENSIRSSEASIIGQNLELWQKMLDDYKERMSAELKDAYLDIKYKNDEIEILEEEIIKLKAIIHERS